MRASLLPEPQQIEAVGAGFTLGLQTCVHADEHLTESADYLRETLRPATGFPLPPAARAHGCIVFTRAEGVPAEGYRLRVAKNGVEIRAASNSGAL